MLILPIAVLLASVLALAVCWAGLLALDWVLSKTLWRNYP